MVEKKREFDLEERLVDFAVRCIRAVASLPKSSVGNHVAGQLVRSGTSPVANYGEAQGAESRADFIHKMKIALKELRETRVWLQIIVRADLLKPTTKIEPLLDETNQLIAIFVKSIQTTVKNK
jgi:four helix bundle protein